MQVVTVTLLWHHEVQLEYRPTGTTLHDFPPFPPWATGWWHLWFEDLRMVAFTMARDELRICREGGLVQELQELHTGSQDLEEIPRWRPGRFKIKIVIPGGTRKVKWVLVAHPTRG